jgi:hypothetical protein
VIVLGIDSTCAHLLVKNTCLRVVGGPNSRDRWEVTNDSWDISGRGRCVVYIRLRVLVIHFLQRTELEFLILKLSVCIGIRSQCMAHYSLGINILLFGVS